MWKNVKAWLWYFWQRFQAGPPPWPPVAGSTPMTCCEADQVLEKVARRLMASAEVEARRRYDMTTVTIRLMDSHERHVRHEYQAPAYQRKPTIYYEDQEYRQSRQDGEVYIYRHVTR